MVWRDLHFREANANWLTSPGDFTIHKTGKIMAAYKNETGFKEIVSKMDDNSQTSKAKFETFGEEMIEKKVKRSGNSGRVYLPPEWVGKHVKIIRIDR